MPKVLRIINRLNLGGPTWNAACLTHYLSPQFETLLVAGQKEDSEASSSFVLDQLGIKPVYVKNMKRPVHPISDRKAYYELKKIILEYKPDIVHTHAAKSGALGRLAAINCKVPYVFHTFHGHIFHSYFNPLKTKMFLAVERYLAKRSTGIIAISEIQKRELTEEHRICQPDKMHVIPLGFNLSRFQENLDEKRAGFRNRYGIKENETAIGIIGRLVPVKNHEMFLKSIAYLRENGVSDFKAFVVGDGENMKHLLDKAVSLGIPYALDQGPFDKASLVFTSWKKEIDVVNAGLDIVALTSLNEGTPVSLIEAQAAGNPVISTRVGGIENVVLEDESAFLCDTSDQDGFNKKLMQLTNDPGLRKKMYGKAIDFVFEKFTYERLVEDMGNLYNRFLYGG